MLYLQNIPLNTREVYRTISIFEKPKSVQKKALFTKTSDSGPSKIETQNASVIQHVV